MVILHVKKGDESQFLFETSVNTQIGELLQSLIAIYNGRLKIQRICFEVNEMAKYGVCLPPNMQGLGMEQIVDLKLKDMWTSENVSSKSSVLQPDPSGRRNGFAPLEKYAEILTKTAAEAQARISKELVEANTCLQFSDVQEALDILNGAVMIVYPMGLPPHDSLKLELENKEDLSGTQASKDILENELTELWWAGKQMDQGKNILDYAGKNEKSKLVVKLQKRGHGPPAREPVLTEEQKKELMLAQYRRQEEIKKLEEVNDDSYLDSKWADNTHLKKTFLGLNKIKFAPK